MSTSRATSKTTPGKAAPKKAAPKKTTPKKAAPKKASASGAASPAKEAKRLRQLGDKHYRGNGVPRSFEKARELYIQAAELGDDAAMENLVFFFRAGDGGVGIDLAQALHWAKRLEETTGEDGDRIDIEKRIAASPAPPAPPIDRSLAGQRAFIDARIAAARLEHRAPAIRAALLPSLRLVPSGAAPKPGSSRLGGLPDLRSGVEWPRNGKKPLSFVAQVNLAELPRVERADALPAEGLLSFFYDLAKMPWGEKPAEHAAIAVIFTPPGAALGTAKRPKDLVAPDKYTNVDLEPTPVRAETEWTLPFVRTREFRAMGIEEAEVPSYMDHIYGAMSEVWPGEEEPYHRMFGHADANQGDMTRRLAYQLAGKSKAIDSKPDPALEADAATFRLLLQIDTDEELGSHWGSGRLFYWIREADLAARRFDRTFLQFQG